MSDFITETNAIWSPTMTARWFQEHFFVNSDGDLKGKFRRLLAPVEIAKQWASFREDCPAHIIETALGETDDTPPERPLYSEVARKLMSSMGYEPTQQQGLGKRRQGLLEIKAWNLDPLPPRRGLGHTVKAGTKLKPKRILYAKIDPEGAHQ